MERRSLDAIVQAFSHADVRYLVVGGLAVVAHGYLRFTADIDLILDPAPEPRLRAIRQLEKLGYAPRVPVPFADFADKEKRAGWVREKGMMVFSLISPMHKLTHVDLFLECPFDFDAVHARAFRARTAEGNEVTFVPREELLAMKRAAGRAADLIDIEKLESLSPPERPHGE